MYHRTFYGEKLFLKEHEGRLATFKYHSETHSLVYKYLSSPISQFCVDHLTPSFIAPNLITFFGFFFNVCTFHILYFYIYGWKMDVILPHWLNFYAAFSVMCYSLLDNIDGK